MNTKMNKAGGETLECELDKACIHKQKAHGNNTGRNKGRKLTCSVLMLQRSACCELSTR